jgi:hypothetical protein
MPQSRAPRVRRKKRRKKRSVFVIARPLQIAGPLSFSSDGKFPICHWGLFVTDSHADVTSRWMKYRKTRNPVDLPPRGTLFELVRGPDYKNSHNKTPNFGLEEWDAEWGCVSIMYVDKTLASDQDLSAKGNAQFLHLLKIASEIIRLHPDYDGYTNNCQNFVCYLLSFACENPVTPKTFELLVKTLSTDWTSKITGTAIYQSARGLYVTLVARKITDHHGSYYTNEKGILNLLSLSDVHEDDRDGYILSSSQTYRRSLIVISVVLF